MSRWLITGSEGQLGTALAALLNGDDVVALDRKDLDITDGTSVLDVIRSVRPTVVINAAAYTAVDAAESDEERAFGVNALGAGHVARACAETGALLVHLSTDYVFSGDADRPYVESAPTAPVTAYGRSKLAGERAVAAAVQNHYIVRTAWLFSEARTNFLTTMMRLEREQERVSVVDDQRGSPTWAHDLAAALIVLADSRAPFGVYHCTNSGETTWFGLAKAIFTELGADSGRVVPVATDISARPARRPTYSVLGTNRWQSVGLPLLPSWRIALHSAVAQAQAVGTLPP